MVDFWLKRISNGFITIEDVPLLWRKKVRAKLAELEEPAVQEEPDWTENDESEGG